MDTFNDEFDLSQSINAVANLRETFNAEDIKSSLNKIMETSVNIENDTEEYLKKEEELLLQLQKDADIQYEELDKLNKELAQLKKDTESILRQDQLTDLIKELDTIEKENLEMKNRNDKHIHELADIYRVNADTDNGANSNESINMIVCNEEEETKKILADPTARANILKLKLFRSLGVVIDIKTEQVFIEELDKLDILKLNEGYSKYFTTKYLWERIKINKDSNVITVST